MLIDIIQHKQHTQRNLLELDKSLHFLIKWYKEEIEHVKSSLWEICTRLPYNIRVCRICFDSCDPRGRASAVSFLWFGVSSV